MSPLIFRPLKLTYLSIFCPLKQHPGIYIYIYIYVHIYRIHHRRIFRSSYRKLAWVGSEPMTTEFRWDALTDWAIRPWAPLALRANFVQLLQFHLFVQCSHLISALALVTRHNIYIYIYIYTHVITYRKLKLNKHGDWRRQTAEIKCDTEQTHGLIAQFVRESERNSVVVDSNPTQVNFL